MPVLDAMTVILNRKPSAKPAERRRHQRVKVVLLGRYMLADRREFPCQTIDMSPGGVALFAPVRGAMNERVVVYIDQLGRIEGVIARHIENGFALAMSLPLTKRDKIAEKLTWLANRHALGMPEDRRHERIIPSHPRSTLKLPDGREHLVKLIDVSLSGAAVTCDVRPPIGTPVMLGQTPGQVVRVFATGVAVEFNRQLPAAAFDASITL